MKDEAAKVGAIGQGLLDFGPQTEDGLARRNWTYGFQGAFGSFGGLNQTFRRDIRGYGALFAAASREPA